MLLVDYEYYRVNYKGDMPKNSFDKLVIDASSRVNLNTYSRIKEEYQITNDVKNATCEVTDLLFNQETLKNKILQDSRTSGDIASESLGPHSVSYVNKSSSQKDLLLSSNALEREVYKICYKHLIFTGLMDRRIF